MFNKEKIFFKTTVLMLLFGGQLFASSGYIAPQDSVLENAVKLFNSHDFEKASPEFEKLIRDNPNDYMLNYYYGACLAEQNIFTDETNQYLLKAVSGNTPDKIFYYVGKYFESKELWNSALKYYNRFNNFGLEEDKKEVQINKRIDYCYGKANPQNNVYDSVAPTANPEILKPEILPVQVSENLQAESLEIEETEKPVPEISNKEISPENILKEEKFEPIHFVVNSEIEYLKPEHFRKASALEYYTEGSSAEKRLQEILFESDSLRNVFSNTKTNKSGISEKIISLEQEVLALKNQKDDLFNKARELEQTYWAEAGENEKNKFREDIADLKQQLTVKEELNEKSINEELTTVGAEILLIEDPIVENTEIKPVVDDIVYKIQVGAYRGVLPGYVDKQFKKLSLLREIDKYNDDRGITVYTTGNLITFEDAVRMQGQVRQEGIKDAFVVAYKNGKRMNIYEAKELTKKK